MESAAAEGLASQPRLLMPCLDQYIDDKAAAELLGLSRSYLRQLRVYGDGPAFCRFAERAIRYRVGDLHAWAQSKTATSTSVFG